VDVEGERQEAKGLWIKEVLKNLEFGRREKTLLFTYIEYPKRNF